MTCIDSSFFFSCSLVVMLHRASEYRTGDRVGLVVSIERQMLLFYKNGQTQLEVNLENKLHDCIVTVNCYNDGDSVTIMTAPQPPECRLLPASSTSSTSALPLPPPLPSSLLTPY